MSRTSLARSDTPSLATLPSGTTDLGVPHRTQISGARAVQTNSKQRQDTDLKTWPRSANSPSEISMQEVAMARSFRPSASLGTGNSRAPMSFPSGAWPAALILKALAAEPGVPDTTTRSPLRAPARVKASPFSTRPSAVMQILRGPELISPPASMIPVFFASPAMPSA